MYQWVDPASGTTQLSGKPPPWYRSGDHGPRVYVFDNGKVIDDTGIRVSDSERERLRNEALLSAERNSRQVQEKLLEAKRLQATLERDKRSKQSSTDTQKASAPRQAQTKPEDQIPQRVVPTEKAMRALLMQWDKIRNEQAQQAAGSGDTAAPAVDAPPPPPPQSQ